MVGRVGSSGRRSPRPRAREPRRAGMAKRNGRDAVRSPEQRVGTLPNADLPPPRDDDPDERLLLRAFGEGDERAFSLVLERLFGSMMATAMRYVRTRDDAEEVVQETWLAALRAIDRF